MAGTTSPANAMRRAGDYLLCLGVTLLCWAWFLGGFLFIFSWAYLAVHLLAKEPEKGFQRLNHHFFRVFFSLLRAVARRQKIRIDPSLATIRSAVVVCNHLSYLDPLFLVALFPQHRTIVKTRFFSTPIFGAIIKRSGYLPATSEGLHAGHFLDRMQNMPAYLASGGNLFIFPEGTRSRDGRLGPLQPGALKIARLCQAPIYVLRLRGTDSLFTAGKFLFNAHRANTITIDMVTRLEPDYQHQPPSMSDLERQLRTAFDSDTFMGLTK
jgi:1-acyl-sn-glycerol-3-phosphate acyltransferase